MNEKFKPGKLFHIRLILLSKELTSIFLFNINIGISLYIILFGNGPLYSSLNI